MVRYDMYCDTGITIRYVSRYIYYPLIYEMQNCVIEVPITIYYNIWGNTYHDTIFCLAIRIVGAVYRYIVKYWWIVTSLQLNSYDFILKMMLWLSSTCIQNFSSSLVFILEIDNYLKHTEIVLFRQYITKIVLPFGQRYFLDTWWNESLM